MIWEDFINVAMLEILPIAVLVEGTRWYKIEETLQVDIFFE